MDVTVTRIVLESTMDEQFVRRNMMTDHIAQAVNSF